MRIRTWETGARLLTGIGCGNQGLPGLESAYLGMPLCFWSELGLCYWLFLVPVPNLMWVLAFLVLHYVQSPSPFSIWTEAEDSKQMSTAWAMVCFYKCVLHGVYLKRMICCVVTVPSGIGHER